ncbi:MAG: iron-containing alcohol dehydrogenase [Syntrophales bacterium]|nr:iron-containing alcohol dehydrogenase [Syntrophales bacterium]
MFQPQKTYEFYSPTKVLSGNKALENLPVELDGMNAVKPLILTTPGLSARGMEKVMASAFGDSNLTIGVFAGVPPQPDLRLIRELYSLYRDNGYDAIIALGGGPVLDTAKALNIAVSGKPEDLESLASGNPLTTKLKPLAAILNLDLSGCEMTRYASLGSLSLTSPALIPDLMIIDPRTATEEEQKTMAATSLMSMTQAVEACLHPARNHLTDAYAYGAARFIMENITNVMRNPSDRKGRLALANAAFFAQTSFDNLAPGMVYELGMAVSRSCHTKPGLIMGLLLPHFLLLEMRKETTDRKDLYLFIGGPEAFAGTMAEASARKAVDRIVEILLELQSIVTYFPRSIRDLGIKKEDLEKIVAHGSAAGVRGEYDPQDIRNILEKAWETRF